MKTLLILILSVTACLGETKKITIVPLEVKAQIERFVVRKFPLDEDVHGIRIERQRKAYLILRNLKNTGPEQILNADFALFRARAVKVYRGDWEMILFALNFQIAEEVKVIAELRERFGD